MSHLKAGIAKFGPTLFGWALAAVALVLSVGPAAAQATPPAAPAAVELDMSGIVTGVTTQLSSSMPLVAPGLGILLGLTLFVGWLINRAKSLGRA